MSVREEQLFHADQNDLLDVTVFSAIGSRSSQQDCAAYFLERDSGIFCVCDGMGGLSHGEIASNYAVEQMISTYQKSYPCNNVPEMLCTTLKEIDREIHAIRLPDGTKLQCGTTMLTVVIQNGKFFWASVGDSRIYAIREDSIHQITEDHTLKVYLDKSLKNGEISEEYYKKNIVQGEGLISFLGIGNLSLVNYNDQARDLQSGDIIVLATDGLYKVLPEDEIQRVVQNFKNSADAMQVLNSKAIKISERNNIARDNMTVMLIKYR